MRTTFLILATALTTMLFMPAASATGPLVSACVRDNGCWGGYDACVYGFSWVPQCVDFPEASGVCYIPQQSCVGHLACYKNVCVPDPCYTTACF